MCKLCDKIYYVTETPPEEEIHIHMDNESVPNLMIVEYNDSYDVSYYVSYPINFCPECGQDLLEKVNRN